jgi:hypothetical protein
MSKNRTSVSITELLRGTSVAWPSDKTHHDVMSDVAATKAVVVFEDHHVVAFENSADKPENPMGQTERRFTIAPKKVVPSLLDIGIADAELIAHLLFAIQQVTYKLSLHRTGFEVRANVLPPYQHRPYFSFELRT